MTFHTGTGHRPMGETGARRLVDADSEAAEVADAEASYQRVARDSHISKPRELCVPYKCASLRCILQAYL